MSRPNATEPPLADEPYRPALHFSAATGWINDPNGLIVIDGRHHAFYQHEPYATVHGPMHWGHAVSDDLVHWEELPIALYPNELGQCYSGSAVQTPDGNVALLYTAHLEREGRDALETQCLVRCNRELTRFEREPGNPVLGNERGLTNFRDPKVFFHAPTGRWVMVLTHGRCAGFFESDDLVRWTALSEFGIDAGAPGPGPWECPDLIETTGPDGVRAWVLIVGVLSGGPGGGSGTQCFVGDFDGTDFTCHDPAERVRWLDHGRDWYAAQSFAGRDDQAPLAIAWAGNWQYANRTPTKAFRGVLSLPRAISFAGEGAERHLVQRVPTSVVQAFDELTERDFTDVDGEAEACGWHRTARPRAGTWRTRLVLALARGERASIHLFGEGYPQFELDRTDPDGTPAIRLWRDARLPRLGVKEPESVAELATDRRVRLHGIVSGSTVSTDLVEVPVELFVDNGLVELSLLDGRWWATMSYFPEDVTGSIDIRHARERAPASGSSTVD